MTDYRDESTFSFDPSRIPVKQLQDRDSRFTKKKLDGRKGVLLSSVTRKRKKSRRRRPLSQQREQSDHQCVQDEDAADGATGEMNAEADMVKVEASASHLAGGATTSADDGDDSGSRSSTPCRKRKASLSPDPPTAPSPQPATPPPQPEPPPNTVGSATVAKSTVVAADSLRPCALVAPQGEWTPVDTIYLTLRPI